MRTLALVLIFLASASHARGKRVAHKASQLQTSQQKGAAVSELRSTAQRSQRIWSGRAELVRPLSAMAMLCLLANPTIAWRSFGQGGLRGPQSHASVALFPRSATSRFGQILATSSSDGADFEMTQQMLKTREEAAQDQQSKLREAGVPVISENVEDDTNTVYLVGVGPGDVELLTMKALRLMQSADLILYDRLVSPEILLLSGPQAKMLYVGKRAGLGEDADNIQNSIHELMLQFATSGKRVVRLKGGDTTVFGRGGEEEVFLQDRGVHVKVVPGITSASGVAASIGVPLTHREYATSVQYISGHGRWQCSDAVNVRYQLEHLADPKTTLVIYMGLKNLPEIASGLMEAGLPADTPAVAVQDGTTPTQLVVASSITELPQAVEDARLRSPVLILIGAVVSLIDSDIVEASAAIIASMKDVDNSDVVVKAFRCTPRTKNE